MHITVRLEEAALTQLLAELLPITILLDAEGALGGRWVTIDPVRHLALSVGEGVRLITSGALRWTVGFVPVTMTVDRLVLMLRPVVVGTGAASRLLFRPVIEEADLRHVPALLDRRVVGLVNRALQRRSERLAWDVGRTLALRFVLPDTLVPLEGAAVGVDAARLHVADDALELTVSLTMHISRLAGERAA
ncbi:MAG TPA: hypothetical protein VN646_22910 [Candidatus Acidoferrum sp.]|jgi:hypothetical protein|nr:hypothetical protein [Candidatus Acidoferrum sp.]